MQSVYRLVDDKKKIEQVQKATLTTKEFGFQQTHGLFGSPEWWGNIETGALPRITLQGKITNVYMGSMGDWPMVDILAPNGTISKWTRWVSDPSLDALYVVGSRIEIDYVVQQFKENSWGGPREAKQEIEIRIGQ
ncbi:hypothetical protein [Terriglobus tenax]|uniref:hypothetical protein n=1 Tax=Terriglobus tenax TaxID=1111115 RepID=UPI0021E0C50A|nr:hypothetical protein [Terriglobus tenax]